MNEKSKRQPRIRSVPRFPARVRWTLRAFVTFPLFAFALASGFYFAALFHLFHANLVPIAESELTRQTGHEVRIGKADFSRGGALALTDVAVSNKATFKAGQGEATLAVKRLTVKYNLHSLIFDSGNAAHALGDITLEQPSLLVERFPNGYNFSDFFKPKTNTASKPYQGRILVHHGLLRFRDFEAPANVGARPALNTLANAEGTIDFGAPKTVYFDVRGMGTGRRFQRLAVNGDVSRQGTGRYRGHVVATDADAAYWTAYFKAFPQAHVAQGRADVDVTLAKLATRPAPGLPLDLSGHVAIRNAVVAVTDRKLLRMPLQNLSGTASFTGAGVLFNAHLTLAGQPLTASGTVFDFAHAQIAISASSSALDPARLSRALPVLTLPPGVQVTPGPVTAEFIGAAAGPTITINASLPAVAYAGNRATGVQAQAVYADKALSIPTATFRLNGTGQAALRATVDTTGAKPVILLAGMARGVNLNSLRLPPGVSVKNLNLGGLADTQFLVDNQGHPLSVTANVNVSNLRVRATTLRSLQGRVAWTQGQPVTITRVVAQDPGGSAVASGQIPLGSKSGRWELRVRTEGLDIAGLLRPYSRVALGGRADFDGKITGPANAPQAVGAARLIEPRFGRYAADFISGQLATGMTGVRLQDVVVRRFPTEAHFSGTVSDLTSPDPALNLGVTLSEGDVGDFLHLAEQASAPSPKTTKTLAASLPNLTGTASGNFQITGRLMSPRVAGHALVTDATVGEYRLDQAAADVRYQNGALQIANGVIKSGAATLTAHGLRMASGAIRADFAATGLDLLRFHRFLDPYADVTGTAGFSGRFEGTPQSPHVAVTALDIPNLVVNRQVFAPFSLAGRYDDGILTQTGPPWRFVVQVPSDYAAEPGAQVEYDINALRLTLPTADRAGALNAAAAIPASSPEHLSHVLATLRATPWARTEAGQKFLAEIARLPQPVSGTFALPKFEVTGPLKALKAEADLSAGNLQTGETRIGGLTASLGYTSGAKPAGHVTAAARNVLTAGVSIGEISADADFRDRVVTVHRFRATSERAFVSASGTANLDGDVSAGVDASNIPVTLLGTVVQSVVPYYNPTAAELSSEPELKLKRDAALAAVLAALPREISELSVNASGPTQVPNLVGSISLSNPDVAASGEPGAPTYALDRIRSGAITLAPATPGGPRVLTVNDLAAFKGGRLVATLSGTLPVPLGDLMKPDTARQVAGDADDLHADLKVQDLSALALFSPQFVDPQKTGGQFAASVNFGGGQLSGLMTVSNAAVGLTSFDTTANKINGIVVLADNKARIQSFGGQSSRGGTFTLTGSGDLAPEGSVSVRLAAKDLTLDESSSRNALYENFKSALRAKINGAVALTGPWRALRIATLPGAPVVVSDAAGTLPGASGKESKPREQSDAGPRFDVAIQLGGGKSRTISVSSTLLRNADASGQVHLGGDLAEPQIQAHLSIARGQFILPPSTLLKLVKPANGGENTVDAVYSAASGENGLPGLQTRVDLTAQANVSVSQATLSQYRSVASNAVGEAAPQSPISSLGDISGQFGGPQRYTITAHIHGILNEPDKLALDLTSSPGGLSKPQMLAALVPAGTLVAALNTGGTAGQNILENQVKTAFGSVLLPTILTPLTSSLASGLGLENIDVNYEPDLPVFVTLTKNIGPRLQVTYSRSVGARTPGAVNATLSPPQYTLKLGYGLTNHLQFNVSTDDQRNNTLALEGVFGF